MGFDGMPLTNAAIQRAVRTGFVQDVMEWFVCFLAEEGYDDAWIAGDIDSMVRHIGTHGGQAVDGWKGAA